MWAILLILAVNLVSAWATDYNLLVEDPDVYSPCTDGPPGSISVNEAFNMDNMVFDQDEDGIHISGNATVKWSLPRTDRLSARFSVMHHTRGTWEPTVISQVTRDFCAVFYHKDQYWYKYWFQNAANLEEIKKNCLASKDTVMIFNPFIMHLRLNNINGASFRGRYKAVFHIEAFDENNKRRPTSLCFEFRGEIEKVKD
ncbi:uncharacterized protein LOC119546302 [Drosophila subpulchrella]|uniref:uncharacterized protein LOC119546302 n=1 Tax=Drosophila subpulchrella TaxID=1486046 RepID=UPI0018A1917C|nr:uncharacterized protein LOC119546302 [Drosophila subpulchrella]